MPESGTSGSMSGMWKRSRVKLGRHPQTKGRDTDRPNLNHRATSRLYATAPQPRSPCGGPSQGKTTCGLAQRASTIQAALDEVQPDMTIRLLDDAVSEKY